MAQNSSNPVIVVAKEHAWEKNLLFLISRAWPLWENSHYSSVVIVFFCLSLFGSEVSRGTEVHSRVEELKPLISGWKAKKRSPKEP